MQLFGIDLAEKPELAKRIFGYAIDPPDLPATLTGTQYLELVSSIRRCASNDWFRADLIGLLALGKWLHLSIGQYSYGTRMKLSIAAALLGNPPLIILDESLNGLDPVIAWRVKRLLVEMVNTHRHAVLLSTHVLETVESLCSVAVLAGGRKNQCTLGQRSVAASKARCRRPSSVRDGRTWRSVVNVSGAQLNAKVSKSRPT
jgi:ABC-2 type transport system ATP-binding protein